MKETENHLLGHLSICDSWLKLRRHVAVSFAFSGQNWSECTELSSLIFDYHGWNLQKIISKELRLLVKSKTMHDQLQLVNFQVRFFFLSINSPVNPLIYSRKTRHVFHAIMEILRNIMPHPHQWGNKDIVKKLGSTTCTTILKVRMNLYDLPFFAIVNLRLVPLSKCALISRVTSNGACE